MLWSRVLNKDIARGLEVNFGNVEAVLELIHQRARGYSFEVMVGKGIKRWKNIIYKNNAYEKKICILFKITSFWV